MGEILGGIICEEESDREEADEPGTAEILETRKGKRPAEMLHHY